MRNRHTHTHTHTHRCCVTMRGLNIIGDPTESEVKPNSGKLVSDIFSYTRDVFGEVLSTPDRVSDYLHVIIEPYVD